MGNQRIANKEIIPVVPTGKKKFSIKDVFGKLKKGNGHNLTLDKIPEKEEERKFVKNEQKKFVSGWKKVAMVASVGIPLSLIGVGGAPLENNAKETGTSTSHVSVPVLYMITPVLGTDILSLKVNGVKRQDNSISVSLTNIEPNKNKAKAVFPKNAKDIEIRETKNGNGYFIFIHDMNGLIAVDGFTNPVVVGGEQISDLTTIGIRSIETISKIDIIKKIEKNTLVIAGKTFFEFPDNRPSTGVEISYIFEDLKKKGVEVKDVSKQFEISDKVETYKGADVFIIKVIKAKDEKGNDEKGNTVGWYGVAPSLGVIGEWEPPKDQTKN